MKELIDLHDYLFAVADVGDWDGEEELVADRINAIFHAVWLQLDDDITPATADQLFNELWNELRGNTVLLEADEDELIDWALAYSMKRLEERDSDDDEDDEDVDDTDTDDDEEYY